MPEWADLAPDLGFLPTLPKKIVPTHGIAIYLTRFGGCY